MPDLIIKSMVVLFGCLIGSFLNVCIYRMPRSGKVAPEDFLKISGSKEHSDKLWEDLISSGYIDEDGYVEKKFKKLRKKNQLAKFELAGAYAKSKKQIFRILDKSCELSIDKPKRSFCPNCQKQVLWYDNIPLLSYLALGGKCRFCKKPIPFRYFFVEFLTASLLLVVYSFFGLSVQFFTYGVLTCALIVSTFIDFDFFIIPDEITLGGLIVGIVLSGIFPQLHGASSWLDSLIKSGLGILAGGGSIYLIGQFGEIIFKKESMGGGDVEFLAMIGSVLGWQMALLIFFLAPFFGAGVGIFARLTKGAEIIPYGPYLSLATFIVILWGNNILKFLFYF
ncbi:MAG: A24 family peptidase [Candidatus Omnitrophica bacterium]|nr:A24 family peptidase [Candidatus Omnitrophota bacterium]